MENELLRPVGRIGSVRLRVLAQELGHDMLPGPFYATSCFRNDQAEAHHAETAEIRQSLQTDPPMRLSGWFEAMDTVDITLRAVAWKAHSPSDLDDAIRINAVRSGPSGYVALQEPSDPAGESGDIVVYETEALSLADAVVSLLPTSNGGTMRPMNIRQGSRADAPDAPLPKLQAHGYIEAVKGVAMDWLPKYGPDTIQWQTFTGDGQYVLRTTPPPAEWVPGDSGALTASVNRRIARFVARIKEERRYV